jgi:hypothetical protein
MYATAMVHANEGLKETDLIIFPWEEEEIKKQLHLEELMLEETVKKNQEFWAMRDAKIAGKA